MSGSRSDLSNSSKHGFRDEKRPKWVQIFFGVFTFISHAETTPETPHRYQIVSIFSEEIEFPWVVVDRTRIELDFPTMLSAKSRAWNPLPKCSLAYGTILINCVRP